MLLAILATLTMAVSVAAEDVSPVPETLPEIDANVSYSESYENKENNNEPECKPNCEAGIPLDDYTDY